MDTHLQWAVIYLAMWLWGMICMFVRQREVEPLWETMLLYFVAALIAVAAALIIRRIE